MAGPDGLEAANNTSGYNCRRVAGTDAWSAHARGAAIDINPVQNPYVTGSSIHPPAGARFATIDRFRADRRGPMGAIRAGDVVVRAFDGIGWDWGGDWSTSPDYQHFSASSDRRGNGTSLPRNEPGDSTTPKQAVTSRDVGG